MATQTAPTARRTIPYNLILEARQHVYEAAIRTPLVRLNWEKSPAEIYLKLENLQPIGSFKIRGAYNAVRQLAPEQRKAGVWTISAGNAAQGVALAAQRAGVPCRVLLMDKAPDTKIAAITRLGASFVKAPFDECWKAMGERCHPQMPGTFVHPFEDDAFIAGNASIGMEILEDLPDVDAVVAAFGGGGLSCGIAAAITATRPQVKIYGAEPETATPLQASFAAGVASDAPHWRESWVEGSGGKSVFPRMWALAHHLLARSIVVTLDQIKAAMKLVAERNHVIAEGAGACAVAAGLTGEAGKGKIVCIVSGGNIDLSRFRELTA